MGSKDIDGGKSDSASGRVPSVTEGAKSVAMMNVVGDMSDTVSVQTKVVGMSEVEGGKSDPVSVTVTSVRDGDRSAKMNVVGEKQRWKKLCNLST